MFTKYLSYVMLSALLGFSYLILLMQQIQLSFHFIDVKTDTKIGYRTYPRAQTLKVVDLRYAAGPHISWVSVLHCSGQSGLSTHGVVGLLLSNECIFIVFPLYHCLRRQFSAPTPTH